MKKHGAKILTLEMDELGGVTEKHGYIIKSKNQNQSNTANSSDEGSR